MWAFSSCSEWGLISRFLLVVASLVTEYGLWSSRASALAAHRLYRMHAQQVWGLSFVAHGMWNLLGPGIKSMPLILAGGFLTTGPPGKSPKVFPLELRKGHGGWYLAYKKWETERPLGWEVPRALLGMRKRLLVL